MSRYYNMTRMPLVVSLRDGSTARLLPRAVLTCSVEQDRSADINAKVRKGQLRCLEASTPASEVETLPAPAPEAPVPQDLVATPAPEVDTEVAEAPSSSVELEAPVASSDAPKEDSSEIEDTRKSRGQFKKNRS